MMAAGSPEAPAPTMTTSAVWSKRGCAVAVAAPRPAAAVPFRKFLRFTARFFFSMAGAPSRAIWFIIAHVPAWRSAADGDVRPAGSGQLRLKRVPGTVQNGGSAHQHDF